MVNMNEFELKSGLFDLRKPSWKNMEALIDEMKRGMLLEDKLLAEYIKSGNATESPAETDYLYERFPVLVDIIRDLITLHKYPYPKG